MAWVTALLVIYCVTECTIGRCPGISVGMAFHAVDDGMCARQWEIGVVVIKSIIAFTIGVTTIACLAVVYISIDADMLWIGLAHGVACHASEDTVVARCGVTFRALRPHALV